MKKNTPKIDPIIFGSSASILIIVSVIVALYQDAALKAVNSIMAIFTGQLGWLFMIFGLSCLIFLFWLGLSPYGRIKLGGPDEEPEYSNLSWMAMLFCTGIGTGLIYWSIIEPIYYMQGPPFGLAAGTKEAAEWAAAYGIYHWGLVPWAINCIFGVPIAYAYYVRKADNLRLSATFRGQFGNKADGWLGKLIDIIIMFGILGNACTVLGLGTPMLSASIARVTGLPESYGLSVAILLIWTGIFCTSSFLGLDKGIKRLSSINIYLAVFLAMFALFAGPTSFILNTFTNSVGLIFQNFIRMSLWTDPIKQGGWPQGWTIFFWAWWLGAGPFVGVFLAKISRGRTIRQVAIAPIVWGTIGCAMFFAVFGGNSLYIELFGEQSMTQLMAASSPETTIAMILSKLPVGEIILPLFIALMFIFCATTIDSASYSLAIVSTKTLLPDQEPARWNRMFWALGNALTAIILMAIGGLKPLQALAVATSFPLIFVAIGSVCCLIKDVKKDSAGVLKKETVCIEYNPAKKNEASIERSIETTVKICEN